MKLKQPAFDRRCFLYGVATAAAAYAAPGAFAEELTRTVPQIEGPVYPDRFPLDTDNDLLLINDALTPAVGQITYLWGRVVTARRSHSWR